MDEMIYKEAIFKREEFKEQLDYWLKVLEGELTAVDLPVDFREPAPLPKEYDSLSLKLPGDLSKKLLHFSKHTDITLYVVLLTVFKALLSRYTRNSEIWIVSPLLRINKGDERRRKYNKRVIFRDAVDTGLTVLELLTKTKNNTMETYSNQDYPLDLVFKQKNLNIADFSFPDSIVFSLSSIHYEEDVKDLKYDLFFSFTREKETETIKGNILYNRHLFKKETIEGLARKYAGLLETCISDVKCRIKDLAILTEEEIRQLLYDFNRPEAGYPGDKTIHELFAGQVERTPDHIALVGQSLDKRRFPLYAAGGALTYRELHEKSNQLAHLLRKKGVGADTVVALMVDRSLEMIVGLLGILKAGGAYLPIDTDYPGKRILSILEETGVLYLLTHEIKDQSTSFTFTSLHNIKAGRAEPVVTAPRKPIADLDTLPFPDRTLVNYQRYHQHLGIAMARHTVSLQATRGCPYGCAYCHKIWPKKHTRRSAGHIFEEMRRIYDAGVKRFVFIDDIFNLDIKNSSKLLEMLVKKMPGIQLFFPNGVRGDILTKEYIDLMIEAGTTNIDLALESGCPRIQELIGKHLNLEKFNENVQYITRKYPRLILEMELMIGFPTETEEEALMTLDYLENLHWVHFPNLNILKIYPDTDMCRLALKNGVSMESIESSVNLAYHELPDTLPFSRSFTRLFQARFMNEYMMSGERLLHVLRQHLTTLSPGELVEKYDSYFPQKIKSFPDILRLGGISPQEFGDADVRVSTKDSAAAPGFGQKIKKISPPGCGSREETPGAPRILLLGLSHFFTREGRDILYDVTEEPLGLIYLLTYLNRQFGNRVRGKIANTRVDFDSFEELERLISDFQPDVIGIRTLSYYKDFFHRTAAKIREWGVEAPIITGGPYATSEYRQVLQDPHIELAVLGEGEATLAHLVETMIANGNRLPPEEELKDIPGIVFIKEKDKRVLKQKKREVIFLDRIGETLALQPGENPGKFNHADNLLYLISTSGSTGKPKGVMLEHRNMVNLLNFELSCTGIPFVRVLQFSSIGFDMSANEIFSTLLSGGRLYLIDREKRLDIPKLFALIEDNAIDVLFLTSGFLKFIFEEEEFAERFPRTVKHIIATGEQLIVPVRLGRYLTDNGVYLHNHYGPAETHVVTALTMAPAEKKPQRPSIGRPISNTRILILDENQALIPIGVVGEIYIAGFNVGRGYLNHPELTAEKFRTTETAPLYRTGDLGRWLSGGEIEFLGRKDQQVKVRGFRIELEEVEYHLKKIDFIKDAVVLDCKNPGGETYLNAYVVLGEQGEKEELSELGDILSRGLPGYMVPAYFTPIKKVPLNSSGKIDRGALRALEPAKNETGHKHGYKKPGNPVEEKLAGIWSDVLNIDTNDALPASIGIDDNFFRLGGNSLKATLLTAKIHKEFNSEIPMGELFKTPTIQGLAQYIKEAAKDRYSSIEPVEKREFYALSSAQKRLYILQQMELDNTAYNMPAIIPLPGELDSERLEGVFKRLIKHHESLRTSFHMIGHHPVQKIHEVVEFKIEFDKTGRETGRQTRGPRPTASTTNGFIRPFDLSRAPLLRVRSAKDFLAVDLHHIISDGVSIRVLIKDFVSIYEGEELPALPIQYKDFSAWQNNCFESEKIKKQEEYWKTQLHGIPVLNLPLDFARPSRQSYEGGTADFEINKKETEALKKISLDEKVTLYMLLLAINNIFLSRISNQEDVVIGIPIAGRRHVESERMMGMFVNTLVLRNYPAGGKTFAAFLKEVRRNTLNAFDNQDYPFERLVEQAAVNADISRNPLFDVMFDKDHMDIPGLEIAGMQLKPSEYESGLSKFDLTFHAIETGEKLKIYVEYCTKLFRKETIERFTGYFKKIIKGVIKNGERKLHEIEIISGKEKRQLLVDFNDTRADYPGGKTLHRLFEEQVQKKPDHAALVGPKSQNKNYRTVTLTYRELNRKSDQSACILQEKGTGADNIVGIMMGPSVEMMMGILGILKAGGAYLPIDPGYPAERIAYLLKDSGANTLLTEQDLAGWLFSSPYSRPHLSPRVNVPVTSLAYVIYTSGSTGFPRGVLVKQTAVVNLLQLLQKAYPLTVSDTYLLKTTYIFDVSVTELFGWFLGGGRLAVPEPGSEKDPRQIVHAVERFGVTHLNFVPSLFNVFAAVLNPRDTGKLSSLKYIFLAGEALLPGSVNQFQRLNTGIILENIYGPTEGTVYASRYSLSRKEYRGDIPIGKPLQNIRLYILDKEQAMVPVGLWGELYISGAGVARGYLNNPEFTSEKFVIGHLSLVAGSSKRLSKSTNDSSDKTFGNDRLYKTGDWARWLPDGNIEFGGRIDHQVKIRGFRIELGEIESRLLDHAEIKEAVVMPGTDKSGDKYLSAFIVSNREIETPELREYLAKRLPGYMIPSYFVWIDRIPLTPSGKIDRGAFLAPGPGAAADDTAPGDRLEEKLAEIWREVLGIEKDICGVNGNFFELGGHSLKATILVSRIQKEFNVNVPLAEIFKTPTIRGLSRYIKNKENKIYETVNAVEKRDYYPQSSAQKRLFFLERFEDMGTAYNMPAVLEIEGKLDKEKCGQAFNALIARHEALRTSFHMSADGPVQGVREDVKFKIRCYEDVQEKQINKFHQFVRPFDLSLAPLLRASFLTLEQMKYLFIIDMHHIISDGTSVELIIDEFTALYTGRELPPVKIQYKDFSQWQNGNKEKEKMKRQSEFWLKRFADEVPVLDLATDYTRPAVRGLEGNSINFQLNLEAANALKTFALETGTTLYMVLLSIYAVLLAKLTYQEDIVIGTPISGRRHADLAKTIGIFVNTLPMRNHPAGQRTFIDFLEEVKENTLDAFENQDYQYEELVEAVVVNRDLSRNPLFDTMLLLQNTDRPSAEIEIPGLKVIPCEYQNKTSRFDLSLMALETEETLSFTIEYSTHLFKERTIARFIQYFKKLAAIVPGKPSIKVSGIEIVSEEEKQRILYDFNDIAVEYPGKTIPGLFSEQVQKTPDHTALIGKVLHKEGTGGLAPLYITYRELNEKANQLSHVLLDKGVKPDTIVGMMVERSIEMIIALLGIVKACGAYLPIDTDSPAERIRYLLEDTNAKLLLLCRSSQMSHVSKAIESINILDVDAEQPAKRSTPGADVSQPHQVTPAHLAYVIFTSGSSGIPKGVLVGHGNVVRLVKNSNFMEFSAGGRLLLTGNIMFDITTFEIWGELLNGLTLVLANQEVILDVNKLKAALIREGINLLHLVPQLFDQLASADMTVFAGLDYLLVGGDLVRPGYVNQVRETFKDLKILHMYGPTENTTFSTYYVVEQAIEGSIPIGKPIANSSAVVVDNEHQLQPLGAVGELIVGGAGVARGYLNNPELTAEKFIQPQIYTDETQTLSEGTRGLAHLLYRTGDLARWLPDGNIEFLGRIDHQVKIRGFRIELGEIENTLRHHETIEECVVINREVNGENQIIAYYRKKNKIELWPSLAEYFVYDDLIYHSMVKDDSRNEKYRNAIRKAVKDKVVLEIGPGSEAILSRFCIEAGAKRVYAVEILEEAYQKARETIRKLKLEDKIILIHEDITKVNLPEKVDCCVSEIVGSIGGSEGAAKIINATHSVMKAPYIIIPSKSLTKIAAITLPGNEFEYSFEEVGAHYVKKVFEQVGHKFDLRLGLLNFPRKHLISNPDVFEELDFTRENLLETKHDIHLEITRNSILNGFIVWLNLYCDEDEVIDTLEKKYIWLPIYFPVFSGGAVVGKGDYIRAAVTRALSKNQVNPDYILEGKLYKNQGNQSIDFIYHSLHVTSEYKGNNFYKNIFSNEELKISNPISSSELREYLSRQLPGYMLPSYFVQVETFPLTPNGKLDRKALPAPGIFRHGSSGIVEPENEIEAELVKTWENVLGQNHIGIDKNFFMIGGDSIKAIQIASRMNEAGYNVEIKDIFWNPTISQLASFVKKRRSKASQSVIMGKIPLTPIQKWFFSTPRAAPHHFNQALMLYGDSRDGNGFDEKAIKAVFRVISGHHDALRMTFEKVDGDIVQINRGLDYPLSIRVFDFRNRPDAGKELEAEAEKIQASINLETGPLMKIGLFHLDDGDRLLIVIHHLIIDGVSWRILLEDIETLYRQYQTGKKLVKPLKTDSYKLWSEKLSVYASTHTDALLKEKVYWEKLESTAVPLLKKDLDVRENDVKDADSLSIDLSETETDLLLTTVNRAFGTEINDILLTAFGLGFKKTFGYNRLLMNLEGHGREDIVTNMDVTRTVGWFSSVYPVILDISHENDLGRQVKEIKEYFRHIPNKGRCYGILKYPAALTDKQNMDFKLRPQIIFNYLGQVNSEMGNTSFKIAKESTGCPVNLSERREHQLEISGVIIDKRLIMSITFSTRQYKYETIKKLLNNYRQQLGSIISFCSSKKERELTPGDFTYNDLSITTVDRLSKQYKIEDILTLSPMQEGMLFHAVYDKNSSAYFEQFSYRFYGKLKPALVKKSIDEIFRRYDILRMAYMYEGLSRPIQIVLKDRQVDFFYKDIREMAPLERMVFVKDFKKKDRQRPFDLTGDVLMRVSILRINKEDYELIWSSHHILMDGWCIGILNAEFFEIYNSFLEARAYRLPTPKPYRDFIRWLEKQDKEKSKQYWTRYLDSYEEMVRIPGAKTFKAFTAKGYKNEKIDASIGEEKKIGLNRFAGRNQVTLNTIIQTVWGVILSKYNGKQDVVFGGVVSGRPSQLEGVESMVGLFINTVPVRIRCREKTKFRLLLHKVQEEAIASEPHHYYPLAEIQSISPLKQDLLDHFLVFENYPVREQIRQDGLKISDVEQFEQVNYDFFLRIFLTNRLHFCFEFNGNVYDKKFMARMSHHFIHILNQVLDNNELKIENIEIVSGEEKRQILYEFNGTQREYPAGLRLFELVERQVAKTPDNRALLGAAGETVSYRELNKRAGRLARYLRKNGVTAESPVGIMMKPCPDVVVSLLAILKAGGAYLPIDPDFPVERVRYMLENSGAGLLLSHSDLAGGTGYTSLRGFESQQDIDIFKTAPRGHIKAFDRLPIPDRSCIHLGNYKNKIGMASVTNAISIQTTRGCPYLCLYCHKIWSKHYVHRNAGNIYNEIEYYYRNGVRNFAVIDDCFNLARDESARLFRLIIKNGMDLQIFFPNGLRGDVMTPDYIDLMVEAGTRGINLSLETASPRLQKLLKKDLDLDKFKKVVDYIAVTHPNIILELATMHGFPSETEEEAMMTLNFIKDIRWLHFPYIHILKIFPNTEMEAFALDQGISREDIMISRDRAFHELPETLPFPKSFTRQYQADFLNKYFLAKERLTHVLPAQMEILSREALAQKYNAYLPTEIKTPQDIIDFAGLEDIEIPGHYRRETEIPVSIFDRGAKIQKIKPGAKRILFLDLSQHFSSHRMLYRVVEQPLGEIYLLTYLKERFGDKIDGRIYKSGNDFDSFAELEDLIRAYPPDLIGIRTLTFFKEFFHETAAMIRQWGIQVPIITGGPYASSDYDTILKDRNIDLAVLGEGEHTLGELIEEMLKNDFQLPGPGVLRGIRGIAYAHPVDFSAKDQNRQVILLDRIARQIDSDDSLDPAPAVRGGSLAYVMYTSGSTGKPKGVMVEHPQVINCIWWMQDRFQLTAKDVIAQRTNLTFDPSVWEIFWPLAVGGAVRIIGAHQRKDADFLIRLMAENSELTMMYCPATLLTAMTYLLSTRQETPVLKLPWLIIGAEPIAVEVVKKFYSYFRGKIVNTYGPTECTINNTYYDLHREDERSIVPIGKPVTNNRIYILSRGLQSMPINVAGEICIAGDSVARGYINNIRKTTGNFIDNPFGKGKLYKSGDIGRWLEDGNIQVMGRVDEQVKVRGYRIEPGEIETALRKHPAVKDCVALVRDSRESRQEMPLCSTCGLTSHYPGVEILNGKCNICRDFGRYKKAIDNYFKTPAHLEQFIRDANKEKKGAYHCLLLYSGGRGAAYALYQLKNMGFQVLAATYDNGYLGKVALENIKKITSMLGVDHIILRHPNTDIILRESIKTAHTVCRGCFHTSSSLAADYAYNHNINLVVGATLSRGQIIENKIFMFLQQGITGVEQLESEIANLQRNVKEIDKNMFDYIDGDEVQKELVNGKVKVVDFYRYCDVTNKEIIDYLNDRHPYWKTRKNAAVYSTNCPIKQVGDYSYLQSRGYHFYGSATSWEKRLGHLTLENVKEDLACRMTRKGCENFLKRIGAVGGTGPSEEKKPGKEDKHLCAYIASDTEPDISELREFLSRELPVYMVPAYFMRLDTIPLLANGKVDRRALPPLSHGGPKKTGDYKGPRDEVEEKMVRLWSEVLNIEKDMIGIDANFFESGGNSLNALFIISRIQEEYMIKMELAQVFERPTVGSLCEYIKGSKKDRSPRHANIQPVEKKEYYALSSAQKRMYILQEMGNSNVSYNIPAAVEVEGELGVTRLEEAFKKIIKRHEIFRTSFRVIDSTVFQEFHEKVEFKIEGPPAPARKGSHEIHDTYKKFIRPFDLSRAPLLRVGLIPLPPSQEGNKSILMMDMHHIVSDGMSMVIFIKEFAALYAGEELPPLKLRYKDYSQWQQDVKQQKTIKKQENYWLDHLAGELPVLNLATDYARPAIQVFEGNCVNFEIGRPGTESLKAMALQEDATLFMVILSIFNVLLAKLSGREDIIVGTPTAGRGHPHLRQMIGMFVNTLALRNFPVGEKTFGQFLGEVKNRALAAFTNQDYPYEDLVEQVAVNRDVSRNPLFDVMFVLQNMDIPVLETPGLKLTPCRYETGIAKFDLNVICRQVEEKLYFTVEYCTRLFKVETIERFVLYFKKLLSSLSRDPEKKISHLEIITKEEMRWILGEFNNTSSDYPGGETIPSLFEKQAGKHPDHAAVVFQDRSLTYGELNKRSNRLARVLRGKGVERGTIVAIMIDRSLEMISGILAILKAGGGYLPLDPGNPTGRKRYMLRDSGAKTLLTGKPYMESAGDNCESLDLDDHALYSLDIEADNPVKLNTSGDLAYVIYTSGSTGKPKGVLINHYSVINRLHWMQRAYPLHSKDVILQKTPFTFDVSVWELFWWSFQGASVCLLGQGDEKAPGVIIQAIERNKVTIIHFVPSMLNAFLEYLENSEDLDGLLTLKKVFASGEALSVHHVESFNRLLSKKHKTRLINLYGPTEATVDVSYFNCPGKGKIDKIPIGKPIDNIRLYIADRYHHLQPIGVPGELVISGVGLARGYINSPELTAEKFDHDLWDYQDYHDEKNFLLKWISKNHHSPIYRTGDLARWLPNGNIEFLGRVDHQVKIRGFRIELGEIECQLLNHKEIKEAVVILKEDEQGVRRYLCAYYVSDSELTISRLRLHLLERLPDYMIPPYFVQVDKIPLTANGKIDRKALPDPEIKGADNYAAPRDEIEEKLVEIWAGVLGRSTGPGGGAVIGIDDNFFDIGGNSLTIIQANSKLNEIIGDQLPVMAMFRYTTIRSLSQFLGQQSITGNLDRNKRAHALKRGKSDKKQRHQKRKKRKIVTHQGRQ